MKCKKELMGLAAILIVVFHFWIPLSTSSIEMNIYKCAYLGVDIFFLISACSLSKRKENPYLKFIANRFFNIYVPFIIMTLIAFIYQKWPLKRMLLTLCGGDFFIKGGGSFLWFAVAIMLIYLIAPLMVKLKYRLGWMALPIMLAAWLVIVCVLQFVFKYTTIFILLNRIPIFLIGLYYEDIVKKSPKWLRIVIVALGLTGGGFLAYRYCGLIRLSKPLAELYYIILIPFTIALVMAIDYIGNKITLKNVPLQFIGGITLELYGMQMIFGYNMESWLLKSIMKSAMPMPLIKLSAFLATFCFLVAIAWVFHFIKSLIYSKIFRKEKKKEIKEDKNYDKNK